MRHSRLPSRRASWQHLAGAALAALLGIVAPVLPALAGSLQVTPISLEFAPDQQSQALWLSNSGTQPIRAQVRVHLWTQEGATDELQPTDALLASPPILEIAAGQRQLVRIVRPQVSPLAQEAAYRLLVDELPADDDAQAVGLQFLLRYSIPVFLLPTGATPVLEQVGERAPADLSRVSASWQAEGQAPRLTLRNEGRQRVRISQLTHVAADGRHTALVPGLLGYALAGQQMQWTLSLPTAVPAGGTVYAKFNDDQDIRPLPPVDAGR